MGTVSNIARYAQRPWFDPAKHLDALGGWLNATVRQDVADRMNTGLIRNLNGRVKPDDVVVHVGDFCCKGAERGVPGDPAKAVVWARQLNGTWLFVAGNHDANNSVRHMIDSAVVTIGGVRALVQHQPIKSAWEVPVDCQFVICGHVHTAWAERKIEGYWHINVGVDVRHYRPITDQERWVIWNKCTRLDDEEIKNAAKQQQNKDEDNKA